MLIAMAAHQGEELVIVLPLAMLGAAYFLLKWAASGGPPPDESSEKTTEEQPQDQAA